MVKLWLFLSCLVAVFSREAPKVCAEWVGLIRARDNSDHMRMKENDERAIIIIIRVFHWVN